jgi:DNA-binding HxlR family transcriptional regulator
MDIFQALWNFLGRSHGQRVIGIVGVDASWYHPGQCNPIIPSGSNDRFVSSVPARRPKHRSKDPNSPALEAVKRIGNECRVVIITSLFDRPLRFAELLKVGAGIEPKTLSRVLKYLESEEIVRRDVLSTRPLAVQYALTEKGRHLRPVIESLQTWGERWVLPSNDRG